MAFERISYHPDLPPREQLESLVQELLHEEHGVFLSDERLSWFGRIVDQRIRTERDQANSRGYDLGYEDGRAHRGQVTPLAQRLACLFDNPSAIDVRDAGDGKVIVTMYAQDLEAMLRL